MKEEATPALDIRNDDKSSYRQVMKANSLFGGVQVFNILIRIVKSKFVAVLLGPVGMGIVGLLDVTINIVMNLTSFGLGISAVKSVAAANATGDTTRISRVITVLRRWVWITGLLGSLVTLIFSGYLSQLTFGNRQYTMAFIWLSGNLLFAQLSVGQNAILQGLRKLRHLAKANLLGALFGLLISVPIYYLFGLNGIVPAMIASSLTTLGLSWYFSNKVKVQHAVLTVKETINEGKAMLMLGVLVSANGIVMLALSYVLRIIIGRKGGIEAVGLYNAGFVIINSYVGMIFTAMATDYFPRLSGVANDLQKMRNTINQQAEMAIIILAPILSVFIVFIHWAILLLYSPSFIAVNGMVQWAAIGMLFKAAGWALAYIFIAKGDNVAFIVNELLANAYIFLFNLLGYLYAGLEGLGASFLLSYVVYFVQLFVVGKIRYRFSYNRVFLKVFILQLIICSGSFILVRFLPLPYNYLAGSAAILISGLYSYRELNDRIDIREILDKLFYRRH